MDCAPEDVRNWEQGTRQLLELCRRQGEALEAGDLEGLEALGERRCRLAAALDRLPLPGPREAPGAVRRLQAVAALDAGHRARLREGMQQARERRQQLGQWSRTARAYRDGPAPAPRERRGLSV